MAISDDVLQDNNRPFFSNGVQINKPVNSADGKIFAISRETGLLVVLDRKEDFSAKHHIMPKPVVDAPAQIPVEGSADPKQTRWEELKAKGFIRLKGDEKIEYKTLKEVYGKGN